MNLIILLLVINNILKNASGLCLEKECFFLAPQAYSCRVDKIDGEDGFIQNYHLTAAQAMLTNNRNLQLNPLFLSWEIHEKAET